MPPPKPSGLPPVIFPLSVLLVIVSVPALKIPPPDPKHGGKKHWATAAFPLTVLVLFESVPTLWIPPPVGELPLRIVKFDRVTCALAFEIVTTVPKLLPSIIVALAPEPITFKLRRIVRFSLYAAAPTMMESPEAASEMACPMVLQAAVGDMQLLLLLPVTPTPTLP